MICSVKKSNVLNKIGYFLWGASPIEDEKGCIHLFIARWKIEHTFDTHAYAPLQTGRD